MEILAVQLTGRGVGAIGVVLVAGAGCGNFFCRCCGAGGRGSWRWGGTAHTAFVRPQSGVVVDDVVVARVGEERFEIHLHGGVAVVAAALEALAAGGAEIVSVDEARGRGVFGGGIAGEILQALALAKSMTGARLVAAQEEEGLGTWARKWRGRLAAKSSNELWQLHSAAQWLLLRGEVLGKLLRPARVAIVGPPNAGKSTLANVLLGRPVSITSEIAGTTRDWVDAEAMFVAGGGVEVPVVLVDTAGIRETSDVVERESIARTHEQAGRADVVLRVFDGAAAASSEVMGMLRAGIGGRMVVVANKVEAGRAGVEGVRGEVGRVVEVSALQRTGIEELMGRVLEVMDLGEVDLGEAFFFKERQRAVVGENAVCGEVGRVGELLRELVGAGE